jgi:hypothetical protein
MLLCFYWYFFFGEGHVKKAFRLLFVFTLLLALTTAATAVRADYTGSWQWDNPAATGTEAAVDLTVTSAPAWEQVASTGLQLSAPANICYPFRSGQFHWVGEIRRLVDGRWISLDTTVARPNPDANYQACAKAPHAGTYALFAYYNGPAESPAMTECAFVSTYEYIMTTTYGYIDGGIDAHNFQLGLYLPDSVDLGIPVTYSLNNIDPTGIITGGFTGSTTVTLWDGTQHIAGFYTNVINLSSIPGPTFVAHFVLPTLNCYFDLNYPAYSGSD